MGAITLRPPFSASFCNHLRATAQNIPGIFTINVDCSIGQTVEELLIIAGASFEDEYQDRIEYLPLTR
jgi:hypothetical protein